MYREFLKSISYIGNLNCFVYNRVTYSWNILFILINDTGQQFSKVICFGNELRFVAMATNLIASFSLLISGRSHCRIPSPMKFGDSQNQKCSEWMHPIFSHQRVWWHHCCHFNLGHYEVNSSASLTHSLFLSVFPASLFCLILSLTCP